MKRISITETFHESKQDLSISWKLLKANWKPFAGTEIFALIALSIVIIFFSLVVGGYFGIAKPGNFDEVRTRLFSVSLVRLIIILLIFFTFLSSQFGLAHDIISSGDMFTEFRSSFYYYRKHWISYSILTFLTQWPQLLFDEKTVFPILRLLNRLVSNPDQMYDPTRNPLFNSFSITNIISINILTLGIHFIFFFLFITALVSVTSQGKFSTGIKQNFLLLRHNFARIFLTLGLYFIIFVIPPVLIDMISLGLNIYILNPPSTIIVNFISLLIHFMAILIGTPLMVLTTTRLYNQLFLDKKNLDKQNN